MFRKLCVISLAIFLISSGAFATNVRFNIAENTTWNTGGSPYIIVPDEGNEIHVASGVSLTINSGVVVEFNADKLIVVDSDATIGAVARTPFNVKLRSCLFMVNISLFL